MIGSARSPRPHEKGGVALTLAGPGVIAAGFALPRDAGRRPALHVPALLLLGQRPFRGPAGRGAGVNTQYCCFKHFLCI